MHRAEVASQRRSAVAASRPRWPARPLHKL